MKKTLLSSALVAIFGVIAFTSSAASASDGTITFTGAITSATCAVVVNGATASPTVTLPTVQVSDFPASGTAVGYTAVSMVLSGCTAGTGTPAVTKVLPYFEQGPSTDQATGFLKNSTGTATGVEVMLATSNTLASKLNLAGASGQQTSGTSVALSGNPTFLYYAAYVSTAATVVAGTVATTVQYDLSYN